MSRWRRARRIVAALAVLALLALAVAVFILRSAWFHDWVLHRVIAAVEDATGGRVEMGSFQFDWKRLRVEAGGFVIHGLEPAEKPPLFRAQSVVVGLKVVSVLGRRADIQYLDVVAPRVYLTVAADGRTNVPEPKIHSRGPGTMETVLKLAIGRFSLARGEVEVEGRGKAPLEIHGRQLAAKLVYDPAGPRYRGDVSAEPLEVQWKRGEPTPLDIHVSLVLERNRIGVEALKVTTGATTVQAVGAVEDLVAPRARFDYDARLGVADGARFLGIRGLSGLALVRGTASWSGAAGFALAGDMRGSGLEFRSGGVRLAGFRIDAKVSADDRVVRLGGVRIAGSVNGVFANPLALAGNIGEAALVGNDLELHAMALGLLGGQFRGDARLEDFERFRAKGELRAVAARQAVALESAEPLPWDALISGPLAGQGSLERGGGLLATGDLVLAPAPGSDPVDGQVAGTYDSLTGIVDMARGELHLPSSRVAVSGAIGRELQIRLETRDLNDFLPVLGAGAAAALKLENGSAAFQGAVKGPLEDLRIEGHLGGTGVSYQGEPPAAVQGDVTARAGDFHARNVVLSRGDLRARGEIEIGLREWKTSPDSLIFGAVTLEAAPVAEVAGLAGLAEVPVAGALSGAAAIAGAIGNPLVDADVNLRDAVYQGEPVERVTAHVRYATNRLEVAAGQLTAGGKRVAFSGRFDHAADRWDTGRLGFQVSSNDMPLDQVHALVTWQPGIQGTATVAAEGTVDLAPARDGRGWRLRALRLDVSGRGLKLDEQPFGDAHLTATTEGQTLRAHVEAGFAGSTIRGDGQWQLEGDYPGSAAVAFSKLDFVQLREWLAPSAGAPGAFRGSAEGELRLEGPALQPRLVKTELRIPSLTISPTQDAAGGAAGAADALTLRNSGPIVVTMTNSRVTVESARLVGRATDLSISGVAQLNPKAGLDLRVKGRVDLAMVRELNPDFQASGTVTTDALVRGSLAEPQVTGRIEFENAAFSIVDVPNGISSANGEIVFAGGRATIRSFTGETGGGRIELSGFASYDSGQMVFRLGARAREVRIRYPEGVSTVADASLSLTGTPDRSMLAGTITVKRTGFNPQSDFSSLIAQSSQPVETPPARTGLLGGLHFDIQVNTATDLQFQSSLAQDLQAEANLQLRGTFSNPAVLGRLNVTRGQIVFFGTKYTINQGSVQFLNPLRIDPVVDVSLGTKARGVDVTLTISGPLHHLTLAPSSDPPLAFNEIVALLATGRAPTGDPALLAQQNSAPQSWQQTGASALLGQAIASPVAGRLQRFFGVSNLRIDPAISGIENNPQARLTLEQQVTRDITFTYITNVTTSNPQVVRVEWSLNPNWSAVALREENGMFGLDFYFKKRFK